MKMVAFIPARSGSERVPGKNIRALAGHPLLAYSVESAVNSGCFESVFLVTDSEEYADIGRYYGALCPALRPQETSGASSPDLSWLQWVLSHSDFDVRDVQAFSILRPTSPFRRSQTIQRAVRDFLSGSFDSLRAVSKVTEHPGKMWCVQGTTMSPLLPFEINGVPWHSNQTKVLPEVYVQNASLEISLVANVRERDSISGSIVRPFFTEGFEGMDLNTEDDWISLESVAERELGVLECIERKAWVG